jgi:hypothetical protein
MQKPTCDCFRGKETGRNEVRFHDPLQDTNCDGWKRLTDLIETAVVDEREVFAPLQGIPAAEWSQIVTLPPSLGRLRSVKRLVLYNSYLVRIPREIGEMSSLEDFNPYTSWRLHWLPYEITRCRSLAASCVSTRCLYGNYKYRPPFPRLPVSGARLKAITDDNLRACRDSAIACSVCDGPCTGPARQVWISLLVATDVLPLLVHACSQRCIDALPEPAENYVHFPHTGGPNLEQPARDEFYR